MLTIAASVAGVLVIPFTLKPFAEWGRLGYVLLGGSAVALLVALWLVYASEKGHHVYPRTDPRRIRDYMFNWISSGGTVAIWTRDHSWVDDDAMRKLMARKAEARELIVCLPQQTDLSRELETKGAEVFAHGLSEPSIRFTIAHYTSSSHSVAIARPDGGVHIIEEYPGAHPVAALTRDLVELAKLKARHDPKQEVSSP